MCGARRIVWMLGVLAAVTGTGRAGFMWTSDWTVPKLTATIDGVGGASSAFGASATMNGEIKDVKANLAVGKAAASALTDPMVASSGEAAVEFQRTFELSGSPEGWKISLFGNLLGDLDVVSPGPNIKAKARVLATAFVEDAKGDILFRIGGGTTAWDRSLEADDNKKNLFIMQPLVTNQKLADGKYLIFGLLEAFVDTDIGPLAAGNANA